MDPRALPKVLSYEYFDGDSGNGIILLTPYPLYVKVLIAEDDIFLVNTYRMLLENEGFEVCFAVDGEETLSRVKKEKPDVVLLDIIMPKMDGFDVLKRIKEDKGLKDIHVIVLSSLGQESDVKKMMDLGASDYLVKADVPMDDVVKKIKQYAKK